MRRAVCLDLDGTLIDSAPDLAAALNRRLAAAGLAPHSVAAVSRMIGDGARVLVTRGFAACGRPLDDATLTAETAASLEDYEANALVETRPYPEVEPTLAALREAGFTLAVVTNKPEAAARLVLRELGLDRYLETVAGGDTFAAHKPDPRHLSGALAQLGIAPERAVMVGDHRNDLLAARGAGVAAIYARFGYSDEDPAAFGAAASIARFADLPSALDQVFSRVTGG